MNKLLYTFFLGYTLLYGGNLLSQRKVADSPRGNGLVDASSYFPGREEYSTPAQNGEENTTLIYGEIINPDSLSPLSLKIIPYYISPRTTFLQEELMLSPVKGEFYDGVMNPRTKKFETQILLSDRPGYLSLFLGNRPLLEDYLVLPGDSVKLKLDLSRNAIIFAGKNQDFYEAQFALKRLDQRREFDSPRQLIIPETSSLLTRPGSREKIDYFRGKFGAELLILKPGKESLHYLIAQADQAEDILKPKLEILDFYQPKLSPKNWDLLRAEVYGNFYYSILSTFRKFHYPYVENKFSAKDREHYRQRLTDLLTQLRNLEFDSQSKLISAAFLDLELERLILNALWKNRSFLELVQENHSGELADRLQAAYLSNYLASHTGQEEILLNYLSKTESSPWKDRIENLKRATIPGESIEEAQLISLSGDTVSVSELPDQPTLVYFYFSSCGHSASYFKNYLFPLYQELEAEGIKLIAISVDEDAHLWKERISKYSDPSIPNFNLRGLSKERWKELYEITSFPRVMLLDRDSRILSFDIKPLGETKEELLREFRKKFNDELSTNTITSL